MNRMLINTDRLYVAGRDDNREVKVGITQNDSDTRVRQYAKTNGLKGYDGWIKNLREYRIPRHLMREDFETAVHCALRVDAGLDPKHVHGSGPREIFPLSFERACAVIELQIRREEYFRQYSLRHELIRPIAEEILSTKSPEDIAIIQRRINNLKRLADAQAEHLTKTPRH
ncbi:MULTISPECIES: hypothetical protein [unclassified Ruegeria]|uniref:hypothetical protein n=1 Tax=unclassified Ruegeria TaxID=2625375 RepID=UPI001492608C|nr:MULTISPECIES: hypothetical protein [unclassified Ruegeria]NOD87887.1 hypothetical protein [Ruegeria sp. HKCCD4318]NOE14257.1 hypothetical protein [Ruegeria sp. HKCCD4318-2]NOG08386.1 hypothetical protein [Ruegeria sp. HKCCD4315]